MRARPTVMGRVSVVPVWCLCGMVSAPFPLGSRACGRAHGVNRVRGRATGCVAAAPCVRYAPSLYTPEIGHALHALAWDEWDGPSDAAEPDVASLDDDGNVSSVKYAFSSEGGGIDP
uniref:Secreted protein n=1 Tax=Eutreptiella gymnastica TaxID=73025 RepID=A0A7S4GC36_9EUGL